MSEDLHRCSAGKECRNAEHAEDPDGRTIRQGAKIPQPAGLCDSCTSAISHAIEDMAATWLALHIAIGDNTRRQGQKVSITRSAPININTDVDALKVDIIEWLTAAAARIAEQLNVDDPQPANSTDLEHARIVLACTRLLAPNIDKLIALPSEDINIWLGHGETERPGEFWKDTWGVHHGRRIVPMTGIDLALKLARLRSKARKLLGLTNPADIMPLPCPGCSQVTLKRRHFLQYSTGPKKLDDAEVDRIDCTNCGLDWPYERYRHLCEIWVQEDEMERDKLEKQLEEANRELEITRWLLAKRDWQFALAAECTDIPAAVFVKEVVMVDVTPWDQLMTDKDIASLIGVSDSTIRSWASRGQIARHTVDDGSVLFEAREVWEYAKTTRGATRTTVA